MVQLSAACQLWADSYAACVSLENVVSTSSNHSGHPVLCLTGQQLPVCTGVEGVVLIPMMQFV